MQLNHKFKIGDEVYHVSNRNRKLIMAVEDINNDKIQCSFYKESSKTFEFQEFNYTSLRKVNKGPIMRK